MRTFLLALVAAAAAAAVASAAAAEGRWHNYQVGVGKADVTGIVAGVGLQGYAVKPQVAAGLWQRLWARAFVIAEGGKTAADGRKGVCVCVIDTWGVSLLMRRRVLEGVAARVGEGVYTESNLVLHATHTHAGPAGANGWALYDLVNKGFDPRVFRAVVDGAVEAIVAAHGSLATGHVYVGHADAPAGLQTQRSPEAFRENPEFKADPAMRDTDRRMTLLRFTDAEGKNIGALNFFALHPTSLSAKNLLVSGDNKGVSEWLSEQRHGAGFVSAFAQGCSGDVTPNKPSGGAKTWKPKKNVLFERPPLRDVAAAQEALANKIIEAGGRELKGSLAGSAHNVDFSKRGACAAGVGFNMLAGTEDGRGTFLTHEGKTGKSALIAMFKWTSPIAVGSPSKADKRCHKPKHIAIRGEGARDQKFPRVPPVVPVQALRVGDLLIVAVPFEVTTVAAMRLRATALKAASGKGVTEVLLAPLSGSYTGYITTREEYRVQHYEGASTLFGPNQLAVLQHEVAAAAAAAASGSAPPSGDVPVVPDETQMWRTRPVGDAGETTRLRKGQTLGQVLSSPPANVQRGAEVKAVFVGSHPAKAAAGPNRAASYCTVERKADGAGWTQHRTDDHLETRFLYAKGKHTCVWTAGAKDAGGRFRVCAFGAEGDAAWTGCSKSFRVI